MEIEVVSCKKCGSRYNGSVYSECPYCAQKDSNGGKKKSDEDTSKTSSGWSFPWGKKKTPVNEVKPAAPSETKPVTAQIKPESDGYYDAVSQPASSSKNEVIHPTVGYYSTDDTEKKFSGSDNEVVQHGDATNTSDESYAESDKRASESVAVPSKPETSNIQPISQQVQRIGKTTAKYMNTRDGEVSYPAVGWLLCVKGVYYGKSFQLKSGVTSVGRNPEWEIALVKDSSVSGKGKLKIKFDAKNMRYSATADDEAMCYINGDNLDSTTKVELYGFEEIVLGEADENMFLFIPLCGEKFDWSKYPNK